MILAVKKSKTNDKEQAKTLAQIADIKAYYGIKDHCLESLLDESALVD